MSTPAPQASSPSQQEDWRWQLRNRICTPRELAQALELAPEELAGAEMVGRQRLPIAITPYYLGLLDRRDPNCPLRRQVVPRLAEAKEVVGDCTDPLGEDEHTPVPHLVHRYPDRALLLVTNRCAVYCRFCTRGRSVGRGGGARSLDELQLAFDYLQSHHEIKDVIVSGGDPLILSTGRLSQLVAAVRRVPSVETIRLATRAPVVLPQRIDHDLVQALRQYHPLWVMTHFNHHRELTPRAAEACRRFIDAGFPVNNQTVLLKGVNDSAEALEELFRGLVRHRIRPYYLLQADPMRGTGHMRTALAEGVALMERLRGRLSGIALPQFVVDTPRGRGKVPVGPDYVVARRSGATLLRTPEGDEVEYVDPQ